MFDQFRNPELAILPEVNEIVVDEDGNSIEISFVSTFKSNDEMVDLINKVIEKERSLPNGVRFKSIKEIIPNSTRDGFTIKLIDPKVPHLREIKPGHFASCLLYDAPESSSQPEFADVSKQAAYSR
jgi:peptide/nickel transport system ATP-binding protein